MATLTLRPNGNGTYQEWTGPLFGIHWQQVDEITQDGDTTFLYDDGITIPDGSPATDSFDLTSPPPGSSGVVEKIEISFYGKLTAGTGKIGPMLYLSSSRTDGVQEILTSSYALYTQELARPGGGNWLWNDLINLEVGVISSNGSGCKLGNCIRCTQIYVTVTYFDRFKHMDGTGHVESPFMEPKLIISDAVSDLSGGADFDSQLIREAEVSEDWDAWGTAGSSTETNYWYTNANDPLNDDWETGDIYLLFEIKNNESSSDLHFRFRVSRINNSGVAQESSSWSSWYDSPWDDREECILILSDVSWTSGAKTDRLRIDLETKNDHTSPKIMGIYLDDGSSYLNTEIHLWCTLDIDATGHIIQGRTYGITGKGHVKEIDRQTDILGIGHILQERQSDIEGIGHVIQGRSEDITGTGHILQNRSEDIIGKGHVLQNRTDTILAKGHILQIRTKDMTGKGHIADSVSPSPSPFPSPLEREYDITGKGYVLQNRTKDITGKGYIAQNRSEDIISTGHVLQNRAKIISATGYVGKKIKRSIFMLDVVLMRYLLKKRKQLKEYE